MESPASYLQCVTFDEWAAIEIGMLSCSVIANIVVGALIVENRFKLSKLLKSKQIDEDE